MSLGLGRTRAKAAAGSRKRTRHYDVLPLVKQLRRVRVSASLLPIDRYGADHEGSDTPAVMGHPMNRVAFLAEITSASGGRDVAHAEGRQAHGAKASD
jgi:hypothetical protein